MDVDCYGFSRATSRSASVLVSAHSSSLTWCDIEEVNIDIDIRWRPAYEDACVLSRGDLDPRLE